jgi:hypothetical protein
MRPVPESPGSCREEWRFQTLWFNPGDRKRNEPHAAIEAGADAINFGLKHFTARAKGCVTFPERGFALAQ